MKQLIFATSNQHKIEEIQYQLKDDKYEIISLKTIGITEDIPETGSSFEENAIQKVDYVFQKTGMNCFGEDSGLVIDAIEGAPGIYSARYAGLQRNPQDNIDKVLQLMKGHSNRKARFVSVIALRIETELLLFKGTVEGIILNERQGAGGFGYDPIFKPIGFEKSFAELGMDVKSTISHRAESVQALIHYLKEL